jgi:hypothetical protein
LTGVFRLKLDYAYWGWLFVIVVRGFGSWISHFWCVVVWVVV